MAYMAAGLVVIALFAVVDDPLRGWLLVALAIAAAAATGRAAWRSRTPRGPARPLFLGAALLVPGYALWYPLRLQLDRPLEGASIADAFFLAAYLAFLVALSRLSRLRASGERRIQLLDTLIISVGLGVLGWVLVLAPAMREDATSGTAQLVAIAYPLVDLLLLAALVRLVVQGAVTTAADRLLGSWVVLQLAADVVYATTTLRGTFELPGPASDLFALSLVCLGAAVLRPEADDRAPRPSERAGPTGLRRLIPLGVAALVAPATLVALGLQGRSDDVAVVAAISALMFALVLARVGLLMVDVREHHRVQDQLRARQALSDQLFGIQRRISTRQPFDRVVDAILTSVAEIMAGDVVALRLLDDDDPSLLLMVRATGVSAADLDRLETLPPSYGLGGQAMVRDRLCTSDQRTGGDDPILPLSGGPLAAAMAAPVRVEGRPVGSITVASRTSRRYTVADRSALTAFAEHVSLALNDSRAVGAMNDALDQALHQAMHDGLTGLPNRACFYDRTDQALRLGRRDGTSTAVLLFDLDRFKEVNDTLGHRYGDRLLCEIGGRIRPLLREADTLARLGGDEFCVLLPEVDGIAAAREVAERIISTLEQPFEIDGINLAVEASCGIAVAPADGDTADLLLQRSDVAMYVAKRSHREVVTYADDLDAHTPDRLALLGDLRAAITEHQLVLHFQPQLELAGGTVQGVEALVRWDHPRMGLLLPNRFIPTAENSGLIKPLTSWVLESGLRDLSAWLADDTMALDDSFSLSVNLSTRSFLDDDFHDEVERSLHEHGIAPHRLVLEITETTIMADPERAQRMIEDLAVLGVRFAIDDFGTGYSSLAALKRLPVHHLKIDQSFVSDMHLDANDAKIVRSVIELGRTLGLRTIAEGVESTEVWDRLRALGCDAVQGYALAPALSAEELAAWLRALPQALRAPSL